MSAPTVKRHAPCAGALLTALVFLAACTNIAPPSAQPAASISPRPVPADLLLLNGRVHTMDAQRTVATAVAIRGERIVAVGDDLGVKPLRGPATRVLDLMGKLVLPGFHDAHIHPVSSGLEMNGCALGEARKLDALLALIRTCTAHNTGAWLVGSGWDMSLFANGNPAKALLDAISTTQPMFLVSADGHSAWVNSAALARAHIDGSTRNPAKGIIERDTSGAPSGTLRESAVRLVAILLPEATPDERLAALRRVSDMTTAFGITSVIEANAGKPTLETYRRALAAHARGCVHGVYAGAQR